LPSYTVTGALVGSYPAISTLPAAVAGPLAVYFLLHFLSHGRLGPTSAYLLGSTVLSVARTFLLSRKGPSDGMGWGTFVCKDGHYQRGIDTILKKKASPWVEVGFLDTRYKFTF